MELCRLYHYCELLVGSIHDAIQDIDDEEDQEIFFNEITQYEVMLDDTNCFNMDSLLKIAKELETLEYKI